MVKSVSKLYLQVDRICQNRNLVSYRQVPGSIPGPGSIDFSPIFLSFLTGSPSVPLEFPKLANAHPTYFSIFLPLIVIESLVSILLLKELQQREEEFTFGTSTTTFSVQMKTFLIGILVILASFCSCHRQKKILEILAKKR